MVHFQWKDRTTNALEDDFILMGSDIEWKKVDKCTTGRVFVLEMKDSHSLHFYWMQEPKDDKDTEYAEKINAAIQNPGVMNGDGADDLGGLAGLGGGLDGLNQQQLMQMLGSLSGGGSFNPAMFGALAGAGGAEPEGAGAASADASVPPVPPPPAAGSASGAAAPAVPPPPSGPKLSDVLKPDSVIPLLDKPEFHQRLMEFLPEANRNNPTELAETLRSPQFRQALESFGSALETGQLAAYMPQFGLTPVSGGGDVEVFLRAIQSAADAARGSSGDAAEKK